MGEVGGDVGGIEEEVGGGGAAVAAPPPAASPADAPAATLVDRLAAAGRPPVSRWLMRRPNPGDDMLLL